MGSSNGKPVLRDDDVEAIMKTSGMSEDQVRRDFKIFVKQYPTGAMKPTVFKQMVYKMLPITEAEKMESHVLRVYDENNDGVVDFTEFMVMYYIMTDGTPEEVLIKIFRIFDVNSDGVISNAEMVKLITDMYGMLKKEDPNIHAKELVAKNAFLEMDTNQDGVVSLEEFLSACLGQSELCQLLALKAIEIFAE